VVHSDEIFKMVVKELDLSPDKKASLLAGNDRRSWDVSGSVRISSCSCSCSSSGSSSSGSTSSSSSSRIVANRQI